MEELKVSVISVLMACLLLLGGCHSGGGGDYVPETPQLALSINKLPFDGVVVGQTKTLGFTVSNTGRVPIVFSADMKVTGRDSAEFSVTGSCGFSEPLEPGAVCDIEVAFSPSSVGQKQAYISLKDVADADVDTADDNESSVLLKTVSSDISEGTGEEGTISLSGEGLPVPVAVIGYSGDITGNIMDFGKAEIGAESARTVKFSNSGTANLVISDIILSGDDSFVVLQHGCDAAIAPGSYCTADIIVKPLSGGYKSALLEVLSNDGDKPSVTFEIAAEAYSVGLELSDYSAGFGEKPLNETYYKEIKAVNTGTGVITIEDTSVSGAGFTVGKGCDTIMPGESCSLKIGFTPTLAIIYAGELTFGYSATEESGSVVVPLSGEGIKPELTVSEEAVDFGNVDKGMSKDKTVTLKNSGKDNLVISRIAADVNPNYLINAASCVKTLVRNEECKIDIHFTPKEYGAINTSIEIISDDPAGNKKIKFSGTGSGIDFTAVSELDFGKVKVPAVKQVSFKNTGYDNIVFNEAETFGEYFKIVGNGCTSIGRDESCVIDIEFTPPLMAAVYGSLDVVFNGNEKYSVALQGEGISPKAELSDTEIDFGSVNLNASGTRTVKVFNTGTDNLLLSDFRITGAGYSIKSNTCESGLPAGGQCEITVELIPADMGTKTGGLSFNTSDTAKPEITIALSGKGVLAELIANPSNLIFGDVLTETESESKAVILTNKGNLDIELTISSETEEFVQENTCGSLLAEGQDCAVTVKFKPSSDREKTGALKIVSNDHRNPVKSVSLTGIGVSPRLSVSNEAIDFGTKDKGSRNSETFTVSNRGTAEMIINAITASGNEFSQSSDCGSVLAPSGSCVVTVIFTPTSYGLKSGSVTVDTNAGEKTVTLTGSGHTPKAVLNVNPVSLDFGTSIVNDALSKTFTVSNTGDAELMINGISATGSGYSVTNDCNGSVSLNSSCTVTVTFNPAVPGGTWNGTIAVNTSAGSKEVSVTADVLPEIVMNINLNDTGRDTIDIPEGYKTVKVNGSFSDLHGGSFILYNNGREIFNSGSMMSGNINQTFDVSPGTLVIDLAALNMGEINNLEIIIGF